VRALVILLLCACASSKAPAPSTATPDELGQLVRQLDMAERELEGPQAMATQADCGRACELERTICDLAERICAIAEEKSDARANCEDGRMRCARAHARVRAQCTCPKRE
jgi:hypothetical protein